MPTVAFLGLGAMGSRMANNIVAAGFELVVWNRTAAATAPLVALGAKAAATPREAAAVADFVLAMVTNDEASEAIWCDAATGALAGMKPGAIAIESSTLTPAWIVELAKRAATAGIALLDAPISGSRPQAEAKQLVFMVGGDAAAYEQAKPVLAATGLVNYVGQSGNGSLFKLAVNTMLGVQTAGWAEVLAFLEHNGIGLGAALDLLTTMPVFSPAATGAARMMAAGNYTTYFPNTLIAKDFRYMQKSLGEKGLKAPITDATSAVYQEAAAAMGEQNFNSVFRFYHEK